MKTKQYNEEELRLLTEVLPNVGSELRAAMTRLYLSAIRLAPPERREKSPIADRHASALMQSYYQMSRLVNNLSDASELADDRPYLLRNVDVVGAARELCDKAAPLFELEGVTLIFESDKPGCVIQLDDERFSRLLLNLLSNALKVTPRGGSVTVRVRVTEGWVRVSVSDTGRGIPPDQLDTVFERFLHTRALAPLPHGLGLGLALCRRIAQGHGGSIVAESEEGRGATFTVSLPHRRTDNYRLSDSMPLDSTGGFNPLLVELSDALGIEAFAGRYLD